MYYQSNFFINLKRKLAFYPCKMIYLICNKGVQTEPLAKIQNSFTQMFLIMLPSKIAQTVPLHWKMDIGPKSRRKKAIKLALDAICLFVQFW